MEASDDQVRDVYAHFGLAAYHGQCFEAMLSNAIILGARVRGEVVTLQDVEKMELENQKKTLGQLVNAYRGKTELPPSAEADGALALARRNYLNHHFFRERAEDFLSAEGCGRMIQELEEIQELLHKSSQATTLLCLALSSFLGIAPGLLAAHFEGMVKKAQRPESWQVEPEGRKEP